MWHVPQEPIKQEGEEHKWYEDFTIPYTYRLWKWLQNSFVNQLSVVCACTSDNSTSGWTQLSHNPSVATNPHEINHLTIVADPNIIDLPQGASNTDA